MSDQAASYASVASAAVDAAARVLKRRAGRDAGIESEAGRDIKTLADKEAESAIHEVLRSQTDFRILSEESGGSLDFASDEPSWIVDPLDGTLNFSRGIPLSCISVALWRGLDPLLGIVHDLDRDETFVGIVGSGCTCNAHKTTVSSVSESSRGVICTGFPTQGSFDEVSLREHFRLVQQWKKVRLIGSAALSLAWVAAGRADAYMERGIQLWDVAAGLAIVRAAGGTFSLSDLDAHWKVDAFASNGLLPNPLQPSAI
jgi:myo-inositol-1(or 4)-monophosphatase